MKYDDSLEKQQRQLDFFLSIVTNRNILSDSTVFILRWPFSE